MVLELSDESHEPVFRGTAAEAHTPRYNLVSMEVFFTTAATRSSMCARPDEMLQIFSSQTCKMLCICSLHKKRVKAKK